METARIDRIEAATLIGQRPRAAGNNARMGSHGIEVRLPLVRLTSSDGASGFGFSQASREDAHALLGADLSELLTAEDRVAEKARAFDFPLWDLLGKLSGKPVYALVAADSSGFSNPLRVPCYDTALYMNDLHLGSDEPGRRSSPGA